MNDEISHKEESFINVSKQGRSQNGVLLHYGFKLAVGISKKI